MLHILLLTLKIIGIIFTVILGILVLLVCVVLFMPIRYGLDASCGGELNSLKASARVTWLLHLIRADLLYEEEQLTWKVRIAWKAIKNGHENKSTMKEEVKDYEEELEEELEKELEEELEKELEETSENVGKEPEKPEKTKENPKKECKESAKDEEKVLEKNPITVKLIDKIKGICKKIKCTIQTICDKIKILSEKKEKIMETVSDEVHKKAVFKVKKEVFKLFHKWRPKKLKADIHYGFGDPCTTGQVLAGLSVIYPFVGDYLSVEPDFENKVLEGTVCVKGHIRIFPLVCLLWNLIWCREVRKTYHDIRNFEL